MTSPSMEVKVPSDHSPTVHSNEIACEKIISDIFIITNPKELSIILVTIVNN